MNATRYAAVAAAAARSNGLLDGAALESLGISRQAADRLVRSGRWTRPAPGIYAVDAVSGAATLAALGQRYGGRTAVVTGPLAAAELGLRWVPAASSCAILVPAGQRLRSTPLVHVRRCKGLATMTRYIGADIQYAEPARSVLDCGLLLPTLREIRGVVLGAVADRRTTIDAVRALLEREPRNGTALLRRALVDADRGCASPPEAELVDALIGCGLPFLVNPEVRVAGVLVGCPDVWFVGLGCGGEMDSRERHEDDAAFDATLARHDVFGAHGLVLGHLTPRRFRRDPAAGAAALLAVARTRLTLPPGLREPPQLEVRPRGPLLC